ncbi:MAG: bifunctional UDP-N-acetylglucosamine diphosphorylase/glucosamine-1-phosphate N-acetyltransferase GlmU [Vampirovibrionales bacterium]
MFATTHTFSTHPLLTPFPACAEVSAIVLAAGKGTRLKSTLAKVLHPLWGKPLLGYVMQSLAMAGVGHQVVVTGHQCEAVNAYVDECRQTLQGKGLALQLETVLQEPPSGTGDAVAKGFACVPATCHTVVVTAGDVPLTCPETWHTFIQAHQALQADVTVMIARLENPARYGRVIWHPETQGVTAIVETADIEAAQAQPEQYPEVVARITGADLHWVNSGVYAMNPHTTKHLLPKLYDIASQNAQQEVYFTDIIHLAQQEGLKVSAFVLDDPDEMQGVNTQADLAMCHEVLNRWTLNHLMGAGVRLMAPEATWIAPTVSIAPGVTVYPGCVLEGEVSIAEHAVIGPYTTLRKRVSIGPRTVVQQSHLENAFVDEDCLIGPFTHLRDTVHVARNTKIGNFVEMKQASIGADSFASHLAYIGDATLGRDVNWGAGAITANFNALTWEKSASVIGDSVKVGSNSVLVAPIQVEPHAFVAAGSVITEDIPAYSLAVARPKHRFVLGWVKKILEGLSSK